MKRKNQFQLTKENYLDFEDGEREGSYETGNEIKFRTREEMRRSGKPIIRLRRTEANEHSRCHSISLTQSAPRGTKNTFSKGEISEANHNSETPYEDPIREETIGDSSEALKVAKNEVSENKALEGDSLDFAKNETTCEELKEVGKIEAAVEMEKKRKREVNEETEKTRKGNTLELEKDEITKAAIMKDAITKAAIMKDAITKDASTKDEITKDEITKDATMKESSTQNVTTRDAGTKDASTKDAITKRATDEKDLKDVEVKESVILPDLGANKNRFEDSPSIFGDFFCKPFTNPFAEAAKSGEINFSCSTTSPQSPSNTPKDSSQLFITPSCSSFYGEQGGHDQSSPTDDKPATVASTPRPARFPGEEDEEEIFCESNVVLHKCVLVKSEPSKKFEVDDSSEKKRSTTNQMKFIKQGEGVLKLLVGNSIPKKLLNQNGRIVIRQKGTWSVLLNSPLSVSSKFELMPQLASGYGVRFVGLDNSAKTRSSIIPEISAYCVKFDTDIKRKEFLAAVKASNTPIK